GAWPAAARPVPPTIPAGPPFRGGPGQVGLLRDGRLPVGQGERTGRASCPGSPPSGHRPRRQREGADAHGRGPSHPRCCRCLAGRAGTGGGRGPVRVRGPPPVTTPAADDRPRSWYRVAPPGPPVPGRGRVR